MRSSRRTGRRITSGELAQDVDELAELVGAPVLCVIKGIDLYAGTRNPANAGLGPADDMLIGKEMERLTGGYREIHLCLNAFGGSNISAATLIQALWEGRDRVFVYVPHAAASAASLVALSSTSLFLSSCAYLTRLDPVLQVGTSYLEASAIIENARRRPEAWDPSLVALAQRTTDMICYQVREVMDMAGYDAATTERVVNALVSSSGFHDLPIFRGQLRGMGLRLAANEEADRNPALRAMGKILQRSFRSQADSFIYGAIP